MEDKINIDLIERISRVATQKIFNWFPSRSARPEEHELVIVFAGELPRENIVEISNLGSSKCCSGCVDKEGHAIICMSA
jgi:hypothetical protein